ncbi:ATPase [Priestia filamentosa]|uniref:ATPase n=1 Tax=Priestia filamentosa TaxID=1402861 RepID=UPI00397A2BEF
MDIGFIMPIFVSLVVVIILSFVFKGKNKVDKGFKLNYFRLSYRRKMIRTLKGLPVVIVFLAIIYFLEDFSLLESTLIGLFFFLIFIIQLVYNFYMWKKNEK